MGANAHITPAAVGRPSFEYKSRFFKNEIEKKEILLKNGKNGIN